LHGILHRDLKPYPTSPFAVKIQFPKNPQDGGGHHFEIHINGHNSVITKHIFTKFGTETKNNVPETELTSYFTSEKMQDGGRRHFENCFNGYISVAMAYICMEFCTGI